MKLIRLITAVIFVLMVMASAQEVFGQTYGLAPSAKQTFWDDSGVLLASGKLCTYAAGTSTPRVTYSDSSGTTNSNPITLDSAGRATIYLDTSLSYKFEVRTAAATSCSTGSVLWTQDNVRWIVPGAFTITDNVLARGTGVASGLEDSSITDDGATVTIDPTGAISILGATTINGGLTVTNGTTTAAGNVTIGTLTVTTCTGCTGAATVQIPVIRYLDSNPPTEVLLGPYGYVTSFAATGTDYAIHRFVVPQDWDGTSDVIFSFLAATSTASASNVKIDMACDVIADNGAVTFAGAIAITDTFAWENSTNAQTKTGTNLKLTAAQMIAAGNGVNCAVSRDNTVGSNHAGSVYLIALEGRYNP